MRIEGKANTAKVGGSAGTSRSSSAGVEFRPAGMDEPARASTTAPIAQATGIDALLALQSVDDPLQKKKRQVKRGKALLDTLDELKADLLLGRISTGKLQQLMTLIGQARESIQPGLDAVLDDIELRARVELAKLGHYPAF